MPLDREPLSGADPCELAERWRVRLDIMALAVTVADQFQRETGLPLWIISGYRTHEEQDMLRLRGRPAAPEELSNHRACPALAVDVSINTLVTPAIKATLGRIATMNGMRWGGGSPVDPETGIPSDWNHLDIGPRSLVE